jgi:hypothetical protein
VSSAEKRSESSTINQVGQADKEKRMEEAPRGKGCKPKIEGDLATDMKAAGSNRQEI